MDTVEPVAAGHAELADDLRRRGVKYAMGGWIDVLGRSKSKIVPVDHLPQLLAGRSATRRAAWAASAS